MIGVRAESQSLCSNLGAKKRGRTVVRARDVGQVVFPGILPWDTAQGLVAKAALTSIRPHVRRVQTAFFQEQ